MKEQHGKIKKPPVVVVMGHIDHGKSTLLDYIRSTNIVAKEAGGITQHIAAYQVEHKDEHGVMRAITFLDTPGHEAFSGMRVRGAQTADIAILVVSAEDSVKTQTLEAWKTIVEANIPFIVAINKIDKPNANPEKVKMDLAEKGIYLEGYGGDIPFVLISAKAGTHIDELLDLIILVSDLHEIQVESSTEATGVVIESNLDQKRGISATLIVREGSIQKGDFIIAGGSLSGTRIMENFLGKQVDSITPSMPVKITGFDTVPQVGSIFFSVKTKKQAEELQRIQKEEIAKNNKTEVALDESVTWVPIIIKTDTVGTGEAIIQEFKKIEQETIKPKIILSGVGAISENDIKMAQADPKTIIIGFHVGIDAKARDLNETVKATIQTSDIIYHLTEFLEKEIETRRPRITKLENVGKARVLKTFSQTKDKQVIGCKVLEGTLFAGSKAKIMRRDFEVGQAVIDELQFNKLKVKSIEAENECGMMITSKIEIAVSDTIEIYKEIEI